MTNMMLKLLNDQAGIAEGKRLSADALRWLVTQIVEPGFEPQSLTSLIDQKPVPADELSSVSAWEFELLMSCIDLDDDEKAYLRETPEVIDKIIAAKMSNLTDISTLIMHDRDTIRGPRNFAKAVDALDGKGQPGHVDEKEKRGNIRPLDTPEEALLRAKAAAAIRDAEFAATHPPLPESVRRSQAVIKNQEARPET